MTTLEKIKNGIGINVLSLCDGMSCGQIALKELGIKVDNYYAAEIKSIAIKATQHNFPNTIQIGDVNAVTYKEGVLHTASGDYETDIDLFLCGSPCQSFSRAMRTERRVGLEDEKKSGLFLVCHRVMQEVQPQYFLFENVIMKKEDEAVLTDMLGVTPIRINASVVTAQLRDRLYWTNISNFEILEDRQVELQDVLRDGYTPFKKSRCLTCCDSHGMYNGCNWTPVKRFYRWYYKSFANMVFPDKKSFEKCLAVSKQILNGEKPSANVFEGYTGTEFDCARYLWKEERARLQGVPEKYVECMSEKEAADLLGDGWCVEVIKHLFSGLQVKEAVTI